LKIAKKLIDYESELIAHAQGHNNIR
jgi:hypothetical protein